MAIVKWFLLAMQFATVIPTPSVGNATEKDIRISILFFPLVGLLLGGILFATQFFLTLHLSMLASTVVSLTIYTLCTGALHLDGLMDTADAIGSRRPREQALEIMKDSRIGAMGAVVSVIILIGKVAFISNLAPKHFAPFLVVPMLSRLAMVWAMAISPSARQEGLGFLFARKVPHWVLALATIFCVLVCLISLSLWNCLYVLLLFTITVSLFAFWMFRKFGGMTGDTYGALNEVMEWVGWLTFATMNH